MAKKIKVIGIDEVEKEIKAGTVCLYYSRELGGAFVPEIARKEILKGTKFCFYTDEKEVRNAKT